MEMTGIRAEDDKIDPVCDLYFNGSKPAKWRV